MDWHRESRTIPNPHGKSVQQKKMVLESVEKDGLCDKWRWDKQPEREKQISYINT